MKAARSDCCGKLSCHCFCRGCWLGEDSPPPPPCSTEGEGEGEEEEDGGGAEGGAAPLPPRTKPDPSSPRGLTPAIPQACLAESILTDKRS